MGKLVVLLDLGMRKTCSKSGHAWSSTTTLLILLLLMAICCVGNHGSEVRGGTYKEVVATHPVASPLKQSGEDGVSVGIVNGGKPGIESYGNVTVLAGQRGELKCRTFNLANYTVLWLRHRDTHLLSAGSETYTAESRFRPFQHMYTWGLRISDSRPVDGGIYECQISTTPPISAFTYLNVVGFNVTIVWEDSLVFPMEYAPCGSLSRFISPDSLLSEATVKLVAKQLASALDFIHSLKLVHRDISPENVLVFQQDLSKIKLCDFGATRPEKSLVVCVKQESSKELFQLSPEICHLVNGESYYVHRSSDVWQLGILIYLLLSGGVEPWQSADDISDPVFSEWANWLRRKNLRVPEPFQHFSPRLLRLFKRLFEPKPKKRCDAKEFFKYLEDDWIVVKLVRGGSFRRSVLERKASSSTNRSRSSGTGRSRNSSLKRKSLRNSTKSNSLSQVNANVVKEGSLDPAESGSGVRDKLSEVDRDFVKERVGQWILEASMSVAPSSTNMLRVPSV